MFGCPPATDIATQGVLLLGSWASFCLAAASAWAGGAAEVHLRAYACMFLDIYSSLSQSRSRGLNIREFVTWFGVGCLTHVGV